MTNDDEGKEYKHKVGGKLSMKEFHKDLEPGTESDEIDSDGILTKSDMYG